MDADLKRAIELGEQAFREAHEAQQAAIIAHQRFVEAATIATELGKAYRMALIRELGLKGELGGRTDNHS